MKKRIFATVLCMTLGIGMCACGKQPGSTTLENNSKLPEDWKVLTYEEASKYYKEVELASEDFTQYLEEKEEKIEDTNEWGEKTALRVNHVIAFKDNIIGLGSKGTEEAMAEITFETDSKEVQMNPETFEIIKEKSLWGSSRRETVSLSGLRPIYRGGYSVSYNTDGTVKTNDNGELWTVIDTLNSYKVERAKGTLCLMVDVPQEYIMNSKDNTIPESLSWMKDGETVRKFIIIAGNDGRYVFYHLSENGVVEETNKLDKKLKCVAGLGGCDNIFIPKDNN